MRPTRSISRRSFLTRVGGAVTLGAGAGALSGCVGLADADPYDPLGRPYGGGRVPPPRGGCTDEDSGRYSDPPGRGRCAPPPRGCTDSDSGEYGDPAGQGYCGRP